jgi:hypothetical protein
MKATRRGVLGAILACCIPAIGKGEAVSKPVVLELSDGFSLEVRYRNRTVRFSSEEIIETLAPTAPPYKEPKALYPLPEKSMTPTAADH